MPISHAGNFMHYIFRHFFWELPQCSIMKLSPFYVKARPRDASIMADENTLEIKKDESFQIYPKDSDLKVFLIHWQGGWNNGKTLIVTKFSKIELIARWNAVTQDEGITEIEQFGIDAIKFLHGLGKEIVGLDPFDENIIKGKRD